MRVSQRLEAFTERQYSVCNLLQMKQVSVKLAKVYMRRVSMELESVWHSERESAQEALLFEGVRFAYRAHQASHQP